jgi:hypothetical protein
MVFLPMCVWLMAGMLVFNPDYSLAIFEVNFSILQSLEIIDGIILRRIVLLKISNATH